MHREKTARVPLRYINGDDIGQVKFRGSQFEQIYYEAATSGVPIVPIVPEGRFAPRPLTDRERDLLDGFSSDPPFPFLDFDDAATNESLGSAERTEVPPWNDELWEDSPAVPQKPATGFQ